jgi:hypothetical protein
MAQQQQKAKRSSSAGVFSPSQKSAQAAAPNVYNTPRHHAVASRFAPPSAAAGSDAGAGSENFAPSQQLAIAAASAAASQPHMQRPQKRSRVRSAPTPAAAAAAAAAATVPNQLGQNLSIRMEQEAVDDILQLSASLPAEYMDVDAPSLPTTPDSITVSRIWLE